MKNNSLLQDGKDEAALLTSLDQKFRASLMRYFARRLPDQAEIEDVVQEVFVRLLRRGDIAGIGNLGGYVFETASSVLKDHLRKRRTHFSGAHDEFHPDRHGGVDFSPEHVCLKREQLAKAAAALMRLPERTRMVFVLRRLEGLRYHDIATRLGISVSAVEKHMARAMAHILVNQVE